MGEIMCCGAVSSALILAFLSETGDGPGGRLLQAPLIMGTETAPFALRLSEALPGVCSETPPVPLCHRLVRHTALRPGAVLELQREKLL